MNLYIICESCIYTRKSPLPGGFAYWNNNYYELRKFYHYFLDVDEDITDFTSKPALHKTKTLDLFDDEAMNESHTLPQNIKDIGKYCCFYLMNCIFMTHINICIQ